MFTKLLLKWHARDNHREMPWKGERNPYKIWISEIILQQTRVEQGLKYYEALLTNFPTIQDLAAASDESVFRLWQGLGYYSRCRNMLFTARYICEHYAGEFPQDYPTIRQLKGVGDYTAAAIASFAFDLPYAVIDGNVVRVLSRFFAIDQSFFTTSGRASFFQLAQQLLDKKHSAAYNQAIMDLGAVICKPQTPDCGICPLQNHCKANTQKVQHLYPVKKIKNPVREREFHFYVIEDSHGIYIRKRQSNDIWKDLYTFPHMEPGENEFGLKPPYVVEVEGQEPQILYQTLSHQRIKGIFYRVRKIKSPL
nr:A/G-specific adenine glycosylase [Chitinophagaceae bacterium]